MSALTDEERADIVAMIEGDTNLPDEIKAGIVAAYENMPTLEEKADIIAKMVRCLVRPGSQLPPRMKDRDQAEPIARAAHIWFHRHYAHDVVARMGTPIPIWFKALAPIAAAGAELREGINTLDKDAGDRLRQEFMARGVNLDVLRVSLQVLAEVAADVDTLAAICSPKPKETRGKKPKDTTRAAVRLSATWCSTPRIATPPPRWSRSCCALIPVFPTPKE